MSDVTLPPEHNHPMSKGEKWFDWLAYGGVAGVGTFAVTLPLAYLAKYGKVAKYFEAGTNWLIKKGMNPSLAEPLLSTTALVHGGNLMTLAVKLAEDNKKPIVTKLDEMLGDKTDEAALDAEPKQSWASMIKARVVAWLTVYTTMQGSVSLFGADKLAAIEHGVGSTVCNIVRKPTHIAGKETVLYRYGKLGALDLLATAASATLLYVGSRVFARWEKQKKDQGNQYAATPVPKAHEAAAPAVEMATPAGKMSDILGKPRQGFSESIATQRAETSYQIGA